MCQGELGSRRLFDHFFDCVKRQNGEPVSLHWAGNRSQIPMVETIKVCIHKRMSLPTALAHMTPSKNEKKSDRQIKFDDGVQITYYGDGNNKAVESKKTNRNKSTPKQTTPIITTTFKEKWLVAEE